MAEMGVLGQSEISIMVDAVLTLDAKIKANKKALDELKSDLQKMAVAEIENKGVKYVRYGGTLGNCEICNKTKFEIDNFPALVGSVDEALLQEKVKRTEEIKYEVEARFKKVLIALCKGDYAQNDIDDILKTLGLDEKAVKLAKKKLKGDYAADQEFLHSLGCTGELEEEIDAIRAQKNLDLIERYFDIETLDTKAIQKAIWIEDSLGITLNSNKAG